MLSPARVDVPIAFVVHDQRRQLADPSPTKQSLGALKHILKFRNSLVKQSTIFAINDTSGSNFLEVKLPPHTLFDNPFMQDDRSISQNWKNNDYRR